MELPKKIQEAVEQLSKIPGVGQKTALRQVLSLVKWDHQRLSHFALAFSELSKIKQCKSCALYCDDDYCHICLNNNRKEERVICVVETISDCLAIEKSNTYSGTYFILGGVLNPLMGIGPKELNLDSLVARIEMENIESLILALNPSVEGDATCSYIRQKTNESIKVERIGFGIPMGGSLEYLDSLTIGKALENRKRF